MLISAIIIGFSYVVLKTGLEYASPFTILIDRLLIAILAVYLLKKTGIITIENLTTGQKRRLFLLSLLYPIGFFLFQNIGINHTTASEAAILYSLVPIFTTVASAIILKEKTTAIQKFGILLSFGGMAYISVQSLNGLTNSAIGYAFLFCSLLSIVLYYVLLKKYVANLSPVSITYYLLLYAILPAVISYVGWELINSGALPAFARLANHNYLFVVGYLGVLSTLVTSMLITFGIKKLSATQASIFSNISPVFGIIAGVLIMGDILTTYQVVGAICIFTGMYISLKYTAEK